MSKLRNAVLKSIDTTLDNNAELLNEEAYENFKGLPQKTEGLLLYAKARLSACPSSLLHATHINQLNKIIGNINTSITNYISDKNIAHITNDVANTYLPNLITSIQTFVPSIASETDVTALTEATVGAIQKIRSKSTDIAQAFRGEQASLDKQFAELKSKKESLEKAFIDFHSEWDAEIQLQNEKLSGLNNTIKTEIENLREALADEEKNIVALNGSFGESFQLAEKERATEAMSALSEFVSNSKEALTAFQTEKDNAIQNLRAELKEYNEVEAPGILASLEAQKVEARKLLGMIGGSTMADGYNKTANKEEDLANQFRRYAGWLWIVAALATGWLIHSLGADPSTGKVLARVASVIILAAPATYMTIESRGHRLEERRNRRYAVEMMALDPYLSPLDDEIRKKKIEALVSHYFGNLDQQQEASGKMPIEQILELCKDTSKDACKAFMETIKKADKPGS